MNIFYETRKFFFRIYVLFISNICFYIKSFLCVILDFYTIKTIYFFFCFAIFTTIFFKRLYEAIFLKDFLRQGNWAYSTVFKQLNSALEFHKNICLPYSIDLFYCWLPMCVSYCYAVGNH